MKSYISRLSLKSTLPVSTLILFILIALLTGTFLRISLLFIYPVIAILVIEQLKLKLIRNVIILLLLVSAGLLLSFTHGFFLRYNLMSLYHMIPFLLLLFAVPSEKSPVQLPLLEKFMTILALIALLNNMVGTYQFIADPTDDSFKGLVSSFSISLYVLVILNMVLFSYYFSNYLEKKSKIQLWISIFFLFSAVMGFYGSGLAAFICAFVLSFLQLRITSIAKTLFISVFSLLLIYYLTKWLRPEALYYYEVSVQRLLQFDQQTGPRKIKSFYNYFNNYPPNTKDFLLGSGPGTFNSRSAFMVGSPSYFTKFTFFKSAEKPYYFKNYAYPLWNETNTSQALFQDGFRNQPFSSLLAFLGEYGLLFTLAFGWALYKYLNRLLHYDTRKQFLAARWQAKFLVFFMLFLLCIDNYFEYPETILLITFTLKLVHMEIIRKKENENPAIENNLPG
ncbi:MAG: hypothetical protein QM731_16725 [Chitinophagaceae bacterium]